MLLFYYIQLYHLHEVGLGVVDVLFSAADKPFFSIVTKYPSSLVLADQSLACRYLVLSTCWCSSQGVFSRKVRVFIRSHVSEATSPLHGAGGVVFGVYILWVSNGAPRRPLDASKGRPSLTSYNEIVSIPLWLKLDFSHNLQSIFNGHSNPSYITCCRTFISNVLSACS
jgi:hypothetical protein